MASNRIRPQQQFTVRPHHPGKWWASRITFTLLLLAMIFAVFQYGRYQAGFNLLEAGRREAVLSGEIERWKQKNVELLDELALRERSSQIHRFAFEEGKRTINEMQQKVLTLEKDLAFYRSLVSPSKEGEGLEVRELTLQSGAEPRRFGFKLVLLQLDKNDRFAIGEVVFTVKGVLNGEPKSFVDTELFPEGEKPLSFKFRYFQNLLGELELPQGFEPAEIEIALRPKGKRLKAVEMTYNWSAVVSEGG